MNREHNTETPAMREQLFSQLRSDDRQMVERTMANHLLRPRKRSTCSPNSAGCEHANRGA